MKKIALEAEKARQIVGALWVLENHNRLYYGDTHNTVLEAESALAIIRAAIAQEQESVLCVGDSSFEDWYQAHPKACGGDKQLARDAYAAGMGDPLVAPIKPVNQEPIGYQYLFNSPFGGEVWRDSESMWNGNKPKSSRAIYAAPVRTKDLTDEEERKIITATVEGVTTSELAMFKAVFRAAVASDREKNK